MLKKILISIPIFLFVTVVIVIFSFEIFKTNGLLLKPLLGSGQILKSVNCKIYIDNVFTPRAKMFEMHELVNGDYADMLVLWLPVDREPYFRDVLIIDKRNNTVGLPNNDRASYRLYLNHYLFQARGADWFVAFSDTSGKGWSFDPDLRIGENRISFNLPVDRFFTYGNVRIEFSG